MLTTVQEAALCSELGSAVINEEAETGQLVYGGAGGSSPVVVFSWIGFLYPFSLLGVSPNATAVKLVPSPPCTHCPGSLDCEETSLKDVEHKKKCKKGQEMINEAHGEERLEE
ncbi:hypothetical protein DNTS_032788 [Danionella cerebrum]|uniref:Uncharacterized protein n=1 Tax=Danionella cerebrum TaxID=2873325 RepID=A0A553R4P0_9TELE|nr:hypothetical protein DNTS_032788 [Danionella translucida]